MGGLELLVIALIALVMFGSKRLPELGRAAGRAIREFKKATSGVEENLREVLREDPLRDVLRPAPRQISRGRTVGTTSSSTSTYQPPDTTSSTPPATVPPPAATPDTKPTPPSGGSTPPPRRDPAPGTEDEIAG
jgi:sec-independent protein translocase protein TatA